VTLYRKNGRRYVPCVDETALNGISDGRWIVIVEKGHTSIRRLLSHSAEFDAALHLFARTLTDELAKASELVMQPMSQLTGLAKKLAEELRAEINGRYFAYIREGYATIVDNALQAWAEKLQHEEGLDAALRRVQGTESRPVGPVDDGDRRTRQRGRRNRQDGGDPGRVSADRRRAAPGPAGA
jgi:hypothetical protein